MAYRPHAGGRMLITMLAPVFHMRNRSDPLRIYTLLQQASVCSELNTIGNTGIDIDGTRALKLTCKLLLESLSKMSEQNDLPVDWASKIRWTEHETQHQSGQHMKQPFNISRLCYISS